MESHWIRTLIGMEVKEAKKRARKEGVSRFNGLVEVNETAVNDNKGTEWSEGNFPRTIRLQYNQRTGKVVKARVG